MTQEKLTELHDRYWKQMVARANRTVRCTEDAEDIATDTWIRFIKANNEGKIVDEMKAHYYLFTVLKNVVYDYFKAKRREREIMEIYQEKTKCV